MADKISIEDEQLRSIIESYDVEEESINEVMELIRLNDMTTLVEQEILSIKAAVKLWKQVEEANPVLKTRYETKKGDDTDCIAVAMGKCGAGKTNLVNNLCDTNYPSGYSKESLTTELTLEKVRRLYKGARMMIYDTPGTDSKKSMSLNASLLRQTLVHKPLNAIFVCLRYSNRGDKIVDEMREQADVIDKYSKNIVFLVSHCDGAEDLSVFIKDTTDEMAEAKLEQQVVFYSNKKCSRSHLARTLYNICSSLPKVTVAIDEETFYRNFPIGNLKRQFEEHYKDTRQKVERAAMAFTEAALSLKDQPQRPYIVQEVALRLKYYLGSLLEAFTEKTKVKMLENDYFGIYFAVQKVILDSTEDFNLKTRVFLVDKMAHELKKGENIRDLFRECPKCKVIWLKVEGCNDATCGNRLYDPWDFRTEQSNFRYDIVYDGMKKVTIRPKPMLEDNKLKRSCSSQRLPVNRPFRGGGIITQNSGNSKGVVKKAVGCGAPMNFSKLVPIPDIDEKLKRIFQVSDICEIEEKLKLKTKTAEIKTSHLNTAKQQLKKCDDKSNEVEKPSQTTEDDDTDLDD